LLIEFFRGIGAPAAAVATTTTPDSQAATTVTGDDQRTCFSGGVGDANVVACGRLIASNALRGSDLIRAYVQRAAIWARRGDDYDRVIADADAIIKLDPSDAAAYLLRGSSYQRKGDVIRAQADVAQALRIGPKSGLAYNSLSAYYNMTGDYDRGLAAANESLRLGPGNAYGRKNRADSLEGKGELEQALGEFRAVLAIDPQRQERAGREAAAAVQRIEQKLRAGRQPSR
jgi:tetratricopeptide (TPR) repeat protein